MKQTSEMGKRTRWKMMRSRHPGWQLELQRRSPFTPPYQWWMKVMTSNHSQRCKRLLCRPAGWSKSNLDHPHQIRYQRRGTDHPQWTSGNKMKSAQDVHPDWHHPSNNETPDLQPGEVGGSTQ
eukprot:5819665-Amphidinium_carterae.1